MFVFCNKSRTSGTQDRILPGSIRDKTMDKLVINWQNFAEVRLQLKFAFRIRL